MDDFDLIHLVLFCHTVCFVCLYWILRDIRKYLRLTMKLTFKVSRGLGLTTNTKSSVVENGFKNVSIGNTEENKESSGGSTQ